MVKRGLFGEEIPEDEEVDGAGTATERAAKGKKPADDEKPAAGARGKARADEEEDEDLESALQALRDDGWEEGDWEGLSADRIKRIGEKARAKLDAEQERERERRRERAGDDRKAPAREKNGERIEELEERLGVLVMRDLQRELVGRLPRGVEINEVIAECSELAKLKQYAGQVDKTIDAALAIIQQRKERERLYGGPQGEEAANGAPSTGKRGFRPRELSYEEWDDQYTAARSSGASKAELDRLISMRPAYSRTYNPSRVASK